MDRVHAEARAGDGVPPRAVVEQALDHAGGRPLDADVAAAMRTQLGHDFGRVRVHTDGAAAGLAARQGARAVTLGQHVGFAAGRYAPRSAAGAQLLAHELVHTVQQQGSGAAGGGALQHAEGEARAAASAAAEGRRVAPVAPRFGPQPQFDLESPGRLEQVYQNVFPASAAGTGGGGGSSALGGKPWVDKSKADGGTAEAIKAQARTKVLKLKDDEPGKFEPLGTNTTDKDIDTDVLAADARLHKRFPQITKTVDPKTLQDSADVFSAKDIAPSTNPGELSFSQAWLANKLVGWTDVASFAIKETDSRFTTMLDELFADAEVGDLLKELVLHQSGFTAEKGASRTIRINKAAGALQRSSTLVHEVTHFYAHDRYRDWVAQTADPRTYGEGLTDWLARKAMTADERAAGGGPDYAARVKRVESEIVAHVPEDDVARAYFQGEVWRLEARSDVAQKSFQEASGIKAGAKEKDEIAQSRTGKGLNEEVQADTHYRFLNLGHDRADPKPEHVSYFRALKSRLLDAQPSVSLKFVGHASTPGTWAYNIQLSLQRAQAFYKMARDQGVDAKRLPDAAAPEHFGEHQPTLNEDNAQTRAFNRRVELFVIGAAAPVGTGKAGTKESEE